MKKILAIVCSMMLLLGIMIPVSAVSSNGATIAVVSVSDLDIENETTVDVCISITNNPGLAGGTLNLTFDESAFSFAKAKAGDGLGENCSFTSPRKNTASPLPLVFDGMDPNTEDDKVDGTMVTLTFTLLDGIQAGKSYDFTLTNPGVMYMVDEEYNTVDYDDITISSGKVTTKGGTSTPTAKTVTYSATNGKVIASLTELDEGTPVASGTITTAAADSDEVYFYFFPNKGYTADGMTVNGATTIGDGARKFTITEDTTLSFEFKPVSGTATASEVTIVEKSADKLTVFGTATGASDFGLELGLQDKTMTKYAADGADGDGNFAITLSGTGIFGTAKTYAANIYANTAKGTVTTFTID